MDRQDPNAAHARMDRGARTLANVTLAVALAAAGVAVGLRLYQGRPWTESPAVWLVLVLAAMRGGEVFLLNRRARPDVAPEP